MSGAQSFMTTPSPAMRQRYLADSVATASPAKLLLMLFDRLVLDLTRGEQALLADNRPEANTHLLHAQDIVTELHVTLDLDAWDGAAGLAALYAFARTELVNANVQGDAAKVTPIRELMEQLRDTWREAAMAAAAAEG
jgi:flagellar protein FliS